MKVSLITVTYNSEEFIEFCINSVLSQDYHDLEYIIIDGNSSDRTIDIVSNFKDRISCIISEPDKGIYDAINKGIRLASGDIVGILNSDDFFRDGYVISRIVEAFKHRPNLDAVFADVSFVDRIDEQTIVRHYSSKRFEPWMFRFGFQPAHPTFYAKKSTFDKYGIYDTNFRIAGDFELLLRFIKVNDIKYRYVNETWVYMRAGGISTSGVKSLIKLNNEILLSCRQNDVYTNKMFIYFKYLVKWWGFIFKIK